MQTENATRTVVDYLSTNGRYGVRVRLPEGTPKPEYGGTVLAMTHTKFVARHSVSGLYVFDTVPESDTIAILGSDVASLTDSCILVPDPAHDDGLPESASYSERISAQRADNGVEVVYFLDLQSSNSVTLLHCRAGSRIRVWGYRRRSCADYVVDSEGMLFPLDPFE